MNSLVSGQDVGALSGDDFSCQLSLEVALRSAFQVDDLGKHLLVKTCTALL